jgi:hypothetical protein
MPQTSESVAALAAALAKAQASNDTHASTTDPDAKLYRKGSGQAAKLSFIGHALMENRKSSVRC